MKLKTTYSILTACLFYFGSQAYAGTPIAVMQFNLHNIVFTNGNAYKETDLMNQGDPKNGIPQYDLIMTEENSTPNGDPRNLLNFGLNPLKYALCGTIQDASLFYNFHRWKCDHTITFDVIPNVGPGAGPRRVTVGILLPQTPASDPVILAATSHWCVPWGSSTCQGGNTQAAHDKDAATFSAQLATLIKQYPKALVIFGGDLNSMSPPESSELVAKMQSYGYDTANPYDTNHKLIPTMGGTPDLIFYRKSSLDKSATLTLDTSFINDMQHLSDHYGAVIAKFSY